MVCETNWFSRFRIIPFSSLGKENGILIGFRPDYVEVWNKQNKREYREVIVGICNKKLSPNNRYKALLNPDLV